MITAHDTIAQLNALTNRPEWKILTELIKNNDIMHLKKCLLTNEYKTIEDRNRDKDRLKAYEDLIEAPDYYIEVLMKGEDVDVADPYYSSVQEIEENINKKKITN